MRIRAWALEGEGRSFRQTVVLSSFAFPEATALLNRQCGNWAGRAVLRAPHQVRVHSQMQLSCACSCHTRTHAYMLGKISGKDETVDYVPRAN